MVPICNLSAEGDSGSGTAGRRTSVLVFFEKGIQQRDQDCEIETAFIRSKVHVEEHMGKLGASWAQQGRLKFLTWGQFSKLSLTNHLRTSSVHALGWEIPLTTRMRKLWLLCLLPNKGPTLLLVSQSVSRRPVAAAQPGAYLSLTSKGVSSIKSHKHSGMQARIPNVIRN